MSGEIGASFQLNQERIELFNEEDQALYLRACNEVNKAFSACMKNQENAKIELKLLWDVLQKIQSFEPDFDKPYIVPVLHSKYNPKPEEKRDLISRGVEIRRGKYTPLEDMIILKNLRNFMVDHDVSDAYLFFRDSKNNVAIRNFKKEHDLFVRLARDLQNRTLSSVYQRAKVLVSNPEKAAAILQQWNGSCAGKDKTHLSDKSDKRESRNIGNRINVKSPRLHTKQKNVCRSRRLRFKKTSRIKSSRSQRKNFVTLNSQKTSKKTTSFWSTADERFLKNALKLCIGKKRMLIPLFNYSWNEIAKFVPNKSASQCKKRWTTSLYWSWKMHQSSKWSEQNYALLIYVMHKNVVHKEHMINWDILFEIFKPVLSTYGRLKVYWDHLKCLVPNYNEKSHDEIVLYLYNSYLPDLLEKCNLRLSDLQCKVGVLYSSANFHISNYNFSQELYQK